ncbi:MAG: flagellar basal body P-ring protein FlgI [Alphaproteobacteria bacterium]|nr:flagellar basal body P-ring protein FlgI [Alphaproteobacteria bacterium]
MTMGERIKDRIGGGVWLMSLATVAIALVMSATPAHAARVKDVVAFEGVRDNMLMGYGLVVGLNGSGDKLQNNAFTEQSLIAFLERQGVNTRGLELKSKNVAAVTITARLPAFARAGATMDVNISAMGDAKSLLGGTLLATPLVGADGNVYAVAQGPVTVGGFEASGQSGTAITKGVPTNGFIPNGALVEREIDFRLNDLPSVRLALRNPDISTAHSIAKAINLQVGPGTSRVEDPGTVNVTVPAAYNGDVTGLLADIETLQVETDQPARIVVDEATGTIVMGENVRISTVAVAQGNLVVKVEETPQVSQPNPFAPEGAQTLLVPRTDVTVDEEAGNQIAVLQEGATLRDLVTGLNALGVGPRDLITILQTIKAAGALQADIETR